jgi:hypothetical protein
MLQLHDKPLTPQAAFLLEEYQQQVDEKISFTEKVAEGKKLFSAYN